MTNADEGRNWVERNWVELVATVLLAVATVATAWSGYQSTRWNGEQSKAAARTNALRIDSATPRYCPLSSSSGVPLGCAPNGGTRPSVPHWA